MRHRENELDASVSICVFVIFAIIFYVDVKVSEEKPVNKAKISAVRNYHRKRTTSNKKSVDFTVSPSKNDKQL